MAGVGLVSFAVFGGLALAQDGSLTKSCSTSCSDAQVSTLGTFDLLADVSWITAAVAATTGMVLLFTMGRSSPGHEQTAVVTPWLAPRGGGGLAARGRF